MRFSLVARVDTDNPGAIEPVLREVASGGSVKREGENVFLIRADREGGSAKELNRSLLSALRRVEKKTRLRAEWTSEDGTVQRFFDYVLKKTVRP
jgi:hypothetical protein